MTAWTEEWERLDYNCYKILRIRFVYRVFKSCVIILGATFMGTEAKNQEVIEFYNRIEYK